jgi:hypothetical protein
VPGEGRRRIVRIVETQIQLDLGRSYRGRGRSNDQIAPPNEFERFLVGILAPIYIKWQEYRVGLDELASMFLECPTADDYLVGFRGAFADIKDASWRPKLDGRE